MTSRPAEPPRIDPRLFRLRVAFAGIVIVDSSRALRVDEPYGGAAYYVPPGDVKRRFLAPMRHAPVCPWRGEARCFTLSVRGRHSEAAAWTYADAGGAYANLAGLIAFHPSRVDACHATEREPLPPTALPARKSDLPPE